jgi:hypothetical protein
MPGYYDIDEILAEEELVSVQTTFDFSYLSQLNPDANAYHGQQHKLPKHVLPKDSILKLPLWALRGWLDVSYVFVRSLPKAYALSSREWLQADPVAVTTLAPRYFQAGRALLHVLEYSSHKQARTWKSTSQSQTLSLSREGQNRMERLEHVLQECVQLRETLLQVCAYRRCIHVCMLECTCAAP